MNIPVIPDSWGDEISTAVFIISMLVMRVGLGDVGKYHIIYVTIHEEIFTVLDVRHNIDL